MKNKKYGILLNENALVWRQYFREMCKLIGIYVLYREPKEDSRKKYTSYAEIDTEYEKPILVGCIFDEHPTQQTLKKMGWVSELQNGSSFIHVDYDLPGLQQGALFIIPSGLDDGKGRLFRVVQMTTGMVYPSSITCEIVPEYIDTFEEVTDYESNPDDLNVLGGELYNPVIAMDELSLELKGE